MSKVCEVVEWDFANILAQWSFLDFRVAMKIFQSPVAKYFIVAALLVNIQTCFYGNQTMDYFKCEAMSLDEYLLVYYLTRIGHVCHNFYSEITNLSVISIHQVTLLHT